MCGIDVHSNSSVVAIIDEADREIVVCLGFLAGFLASARRWQTRSPAIRRPLAPSPARSEPAHTFSAPILVAAAASRTTASHECRPPAPPPQRWRQAQASPRPVAASPQG